MAQGLLLPLMLIGTAAGVAGTAATLLSKPKQVQAPVIPTRNMAQERAQREDRVSRRRGVAANLLLGAQGAESSAGGKVALGT